MLAGYLVRAVSHHAFRAGVPRRYRPIHVEHENTVIDDPVDQRAETLFAFTQRLVRSAALGQIARNLGKADEIALAVTHRGQHDVGPERAAVLAHPAAFVLA